MVMFLSTNLSKLFVFLNAYKDKLYIINLISFKDKETKVMFQVTITGRKSSWMNKSKEFFWTILINVINE